MTRSAQRPRGAALSVLAVVVTAAGASGQDYVDPGDTYADPYAQEISARVWLDRGDEPLLDRGDRVRIYYRTSHDAYVAIFKIDTNGTTRLLYPQTPSDDNWVMGERDYRLLFPRSPYWYVDDSPGSVLGARPKQ